jgi:hypothetical protein
MCEDGREDRPAVRGVNRRLDLGSVVGDAVPNGPVVFDVEDLPAPAAGFDHVEAGVQGRVDGVELDLGGHVGRESWVRVRAGQDAASRA